MDVSAATASQSRDEFLQLLVTQLRHQDPLSPVQQEDFLAQLAQFSTLESVEKLNTNFASQLEIQSNILKLQQFSQAATLIGRNVEFETFGGGTDTGRVDAVSVRDNKTFVVVDDQTLSIDQITHFLTDLPEPVVDDIKSHDDAFVGDSVQLESDWSHSDSAGQNLGPLLVPRPTA